MRREYSSQMGFPRFRGAVRNFILVSTAIYIVVLLLSAFADDIAKQVFLNGMLSANGVLHGQVWQFLTYGFLYQDPLNFLFAMLAIYFIGSAVEDQIGPRAFGELYLASLVGAGVMGFACSLTGFAGSGAASGAGAAANALLMVFFLLYRNAPIFLFPLPIPIQVKYIVIFTAAVEGAYLLLSHFALFYLTQLFGLAAGYFWYKLFWRRASISGLIDGGAASLRNRYYLWKRRRAQRKFQIYMNKHAENPRQYFDEYGNFRPPDDPDKKDKGRGGWVN